MMEKRSDPPYYRKDTDIVTWKGSFLTPQNKIRPLLLDMGEKRIAHMDEIGIDTAIVSCFRGIEFIDGSESIEMSRLTNDALYEMTQKYPGRYLGAASLPVHETAAACYELERCVKELGFVAWHTFSNYGDRAPEDPAYRPIFKKAEELGVYVYLHPNLDNNPRVQEYGFTLAGSAMGFTLDTLITVTKLIMSGIFDEMPKLTIMLGHLGEALPFLIARLDNRVKKVANSPIKCVREPGYYIRNNILVTTSGNMLTEAFLCTRDVLGIDRILMGTDYPHESAEEMVTFLEELPISAIEREAVYYKNAEEKLGIRV